MPIFNDIAHVVPTVPTPSRPSQPPLINTASLYRNYQYLPTVIGFLDGTPWECTFYHQWLGEDDHVSNSQDTYDPTLKQYVKVNKFELRVTSALSNSIDTVLNTSTITGAANVYPFITPIVGDVFVAVVQDSIYGLFEITKVDRLSLYKESAWAVEYTLISYVLENTHAELDIFVIAELIFRVENIEYNSNPLYSKSEHDLLITAKERIKYLIEYYHSQFFQTLLQTFVVPYELELSRKLYDPYLVAFWNRTIEPLSSVGYEIPIEYDTSYFKNNYLFYTVWDAIEQQNIAKLLTVVKYLNVFSVNNFDALYQRHNVRLSQITDVLYPNLTLGKPEYNLLEEETQFFLASTYMFSREFYTQTNVTIPIELLVTKLLKKQPINFDEIKRIDDTILSLPPLVQFYHIPLILLFYSVVR